MTAPTTRTLGKDDWMTPDNLFNQIDAVCAFNLDACATNLEAARVDPFIDPKTDALRVRWSDYGKRVWCNPPYGRGGQLPKRTVRHLPLPSDQVREARR